jgi:hypothetical protein
MHRGKLGLGICGFVLLWQSLMQLPVCYSQAKLYSNDQLCQIVLRRLPEDFRAGIIKGPVSCTSRRRPDGIASKFDKFVFWWLGTRVYRVIVSRPLTPEEDKVQSHVDPITGRNVWRGHGASASLDLNVCGEYDRSFEN